MKRLLFIALSCSLLVSCNKDAGFVYKDNRPEREFFNATFSIHEIDSRNKVDILWVIDNSGSMYDIQANIVKNAELFMKEFVKSNYIDWKMGLLSTSLDEKPYLGFDVPFNKSTPDPVTVFKNAVGRLGTNGDSEELVFANINKGLTELPFMRANAHLAVIMVTDEVEQSGDRDPVKFEVNNFFNSMRALVNARYKVRFYGAFNARELRDCSSYAMEYDDSPYQHLVRLGSGFEMSACVPDFGEGLSSIGKDIASLLEYPRLLLNQRPRVDTIKVTYKGEELAPGRPETGGYWYYDDEFNMIVFYNLNFSTNYEFDSVDVKFEINDGEIREL